MHALIPCSAVFLLHALAPAPIKIGFGVVRCGAVLAVVSVKLTPLRKTLLWVGDLEETQTSDY
jgi:hypothetical protein